MADRERLSFKYEFEWQVNPHPGFFVVVEGLDGSGNSTQVKQLAERYFYDWERVTGKFIRVEKEPTYGVFGADELTLQMGFSTDRSDHLVYGGILDRFETLEKLKRAREGYLLLMDKIPGLITRVDGNRSIDAITQEIVSVIERNPKRQSSI